MYLRMFIVSQQKQAKSHEKGFCKFYIGEQLRNLHRMFFFCESFLKLKYRQ